MSAPWSDVSAQRSAYDHDVLSPLNDREEFAIGAAFIGVALAVLATATATGWGIPVIGSLIVLMAVRSRWRTMPNWLLLGWTAAAVIPAEAAKMCTNGYLVAGVAIVLALSSGVNRLEAALAVGLTVSPLALWLGGVPDYKDFGPWTWMAGMGIGLLFGAVISRQWDLIDELTETRHQLAETAADAERQRIAREMHDVVGHNFSVVLLHLSGARSVLGSDPDRAADALRRAEEVGRRGMEDLRETIGLLRSGSESLQPVPDAADLAALVDDYRQAGLEVSASLDASVDQVAGAARMVTHDVVRESLTNCAKHEPSAPVHVTVDVSSATVTVSVENGRTSTSPTIDGAGLTGLRQRVEALNGDLLAGPRDGRTDAWIVRARIPRALDAVDLDAPDADTAAAT